MRDLLYMAWRYLAYHRIKTIILILSITLIVFLPAGLKILVGQSARALTLRAESTPLLIGAKGSPLELALNSLYFESDTPPQITFAESQRVSDSRLATAIPLYTRYRARKFPIVGTTLDYFDFRNLRVAEGRQMALIGECVLGTEVSDRLGIGVGDALISSPESVFDLGGVYPLKMKVVGVLAPSGPADDRAIFVDLKTAWIIQGLAHGHQDLATPEAASGVLKRDGNVVIANASVMQFNEITANNMDSFHFHGDPSGFPITAVIAAPHDAKSATLLQGQYLGDDERVQIVRPATVMSELLATILTVQNYVIAGAMVIGLSALMTAALVFMLSLRLRKREIQTMHRIGSSKSRVTTLLSLEIIIVLATGILLAAVLTLLASQFGEGLMRAFI